MFDPLIIAAVIATFVLAGLVKGIIGLGLPTVSLAALTVIIDMPTAMAVLLVPSFVTNLWQASVGGHGLAILGRIWPFLLPATLTVWLGAEALTRLDPPYLAALLGLLLVIYGAAGLAGLRLAVPPRHEAWAGPLTGAANGLLTGMTGSFVVPGVMYLQGLGLSRDQLVQAMGITFTASTLALGLALRGNALLSLEQVQMSAAALPPALLGMALGQRIRKNLPETIFRRIFFTALLVLGLYIIANAMAGMA
ncbi:MAG: sulfite exporter TauE/SafE family protein [Alphaproteobacteria bacterium]